MRHHTWGNKMEKVRTRLGCSAYHMRRWLRLLRRSRSSSSYPWPKSMLHPGGINHNSMCQVYHPQVAVYTPHQHQYSSHNPYLWWGSKCHQKDTPETCGGVLRSQEVSPGLGEELREEHSLVREDWGHNGVEIEFGRKDQEGGEQRWHEEVWEWFQRKSGGGDSIIYLLLI